MKFTTFSIRRTLQYKFFDVSMKQDLITHVILMNIEIIVTLSNFLYLLGDRSEFGLQVSLNACVQPADI